MRPLWSATNEHGTGTNVLKNTHTNTRMHASQYTSAQRSAYDTRLNLSRAQYTHKFGVLSFYYYYYLYRSMCIWRAVRKTFIIIVKISTIKLWRIKITFGVTDMTHSI